MRRSLALGITLASGAQIAALGLLLTSGWLIVRAAEQPPVLYLMVAIVSVRFFGIGRAVMRYGERLATHDVALARTTEARVAAYGELERTAPGGLDGLRHGDRVRRVVADADAAADHLLRIRVPWIAALVTSALLVVVATFIHPLAGLVLLANAAVVAGVVRIAVPRLAARPDAAASLASDVTELARAAPDLLAYGAAPRHLDDARRAVRANAAAQRRRTWGAGLAGLVVPGVGAVSALLMAILAAGADVRPAVAAVLILAPIGLLDVLEPLVEAEQARPAVEDAQHRLAELGAMPTPVPPPASEGRAPADAHLRVEGLAVGWNGQAVASGIDLELHPGDSLGISGPSGGGKSTLALTLARLIPLVAGTVTLGGVDLAELDGAEVTRWIGLLGQDATVFDTTIRENLRIADPDADDARMFAALDRAGLAGFVHSLPRGLDTPLGEGGNRLSGGERQRLGLARLLLADHRILVLDEPTEHLDEPTANALLDDLAALAGDHTVVVISHSPHVLERFGAPLVIGGAQKDAFRSMAPWT